MFGWKCFSSFIIFLIFCYFVLVKVQLAIACIFLTVLQAILIFRINCMSAGFGLWRIWSALFLKRNHVILIMQLFRFECSIWKDRISTKSLRDINILTLKVKQSSFRWNVFKSGRDIIKHNCRVTTHRHQTLFQMDTVSI